MRYIAAYLLATMGGNASPSADDVKQILGSVGEKFSSTGHDFIDVLSSELVDDNLELFHIDINANGSEDLLDIISRRAGIASHGGQKVSCYVTHFQTSRYTVLIDIN